MEKRLLAKRPLLYLVTDRNVYPRVELIDLLLEAAAAGVDLLQIRERDLSDRQLCSLVDRAVIGLETFSSKLLVNDRFDLALACGADGVHLTTRSLMTSVVRRRLPKSFLIGVSTHSYAELASAAEQGADFAVLGPIFDTPSKRGFGPPLGLQPLHAACRAFDFPIIAIGGVDISRVADVRDAGAAGIAAIRLFAVPGKLAELVGRIRSEWNS